MVYSGAFSGTILLITFFAIMGVSITSLDWSYDLLDSHQNIQELKSTILETEIAIGSLTVEGNSQIVDATFQNTGEVTLNDYEKFTVIATYDADIAGVKTRVTESFQYNKDISFSSYLGSAQFARPESDISQGTWDDTTGGDSDTDLFDEVDETTRSDTDYASSSSLTILGQTDEWIAGLSSVVDPQNDNDHIVRYVYRTDAGLGIEMNMHVELLQGTTEIASWSHTNIGDTFSQASNTLSATEAAQINDYSALRLNFTAEYGSGVLPGKSGHISWAELEVPNADCANGLSQGEWIIKTITSDSADPRLLNPDEVANICLELSNSLYDDGMLALVISTERGVTSMRAASWT